MTKNYTEFVVRVYHYPNEYPIMYTYYMKWIRNAIKSFLRGHKITVKKYKSERLSDENK